MTVQRQAGRDTRFQERAGMFAVLAILLVAPALSLGQQKAGQAEEKPRTQHVRQVLRPETFLSVSPGVSDVWALCKAGQGIQAVRALMFWTQSFDFQVAHMPRKDPGKRTQVRFAGPAGMSVSWDPTQPDGKKGFGNRTLEVPGRDSFPQGASYRLKLSGIPNRPGLELYPTLEVAAGNNKTRMFLEHNAVPLFFTDEDFDLVVSNALVVKVVFLPDAKNQDKNVEGLADVISTRLEPGLDPITEAARRGSILLVLRLGNIDLEAPTPMDVPAPRPPRKPKDSPEPARGPQTRK